MTNRIVDTMRGCHEARDLGQAMDWTARSYPGNVVYVKLPDGQVVFGYDIEEETLSDGSLVYNLLLRAS